MEKAGVGLLKENFLSNKKTNPEELPSLALAYIGDAVYELVVRQYLLSRGAVKVNQLHKMAVRYVRAGAQAKALHILEGNLTEEEIAVVRRGRNAKSATLPKNADLMEYRQATALEALIGYLYLQDRQSRVLELIKIAIGAIEQEKLGRGKTSG